MTTSGSPGTEERILEGALRALGRHGSRKLTMIDVSESADVSRGTLYRYFPGKSELLDALARYEQHRFEVGLAAAFTSTAQGLAGVQAMVDYAFAYLRDHPALERLLESEPGFVLDYMRRHLPALRRAALRRIGPELEMSSPVVLGIATTEQLVDLLIRVLVSNFVLHSSEPAVDRETLNAMVRLITGVPANGINHAVPR